MTTQIQLEPSWKRKLQGEFDKDYMKNLRSFLASEYHQGKTIYPNKKEYFAAFDFTPFEEVKVVILGQDPYHGPDQAHGLCFSVKPQVKVPPSLINIFKEIKVDLGIDNPRMGHLVHWAEQGVLLLNSVLTVEKGMAASHRKRGWEQFTDKVIEVLNERDKPMVFLLWGSYAQKKAEFVDGKKHLVLKSSSPLTTVCFKRLFRL